MVTNVAAVSAPEALERIRELKMRILEEIKWLRACHTRASLARPMFALQLTQELEDMVREGRSIQT